VIQVSRRQPAGFEGIVGPFHVTPDIISRQIDNDKMEPDAPVRSRSKKIEGINGLPGPDGNARLLQNFALGPCCRVSPNSREPPGTAHNPLPGATLF